MTRSLDTLKYELASAGYSDEQIQDAEQCAIDLAVALGANVEQAAYDVLVVFRAYHSFSQSMTELISMAGKSLPAIETISRNILKMAADTQTQQPVKPTEKTPYYQKNKQQWWK